MGNVLRATWEHFVADECPRLAAALAYYSFFTLPTLLVAVVFLAGMILSDRQAVTDRLQIHLEETMGETGARQLTTVLQTASAPHKSWRAWLVSLGMLLLGASGALGELQTALNRAWEVRPDDRETWYQRLLIKRLLSLGLVGLIALLLTASVMASWALAAFGQWWDAEASAGLSSLAMRGVHSVASFAISTVLFAALFRYLPDANVPWKDTWQGAGATAALFWAGQWAIGIYLGWSQPSSAYGAAGSIALVLLWIYYSALIFLLGAEFTQALAQRRGKKASPIVGARQVEPQKYGQRLTN